MQDREILFQLLATKDWDKLSEQIYSQRAVLTSDPVIKLAVSLFESEFIDHIKALPASEQLLKLRHISLLIESNESSFAEDFVYQAVDTKLRALHETSSAEFFGYATNNSSRPLARELMERTRVERPEQLAEAKRPSVSVKAVTKKQGNPSVTSLFKSRQELNFYLALQKAFPHLVACSNLPVSAVLKFDFIRAELGADARDYFFKAIFDCVVVDPADDYRPTYFFELDSRYHDDPTAKRNDKLKNSICDAAGVKLTRIRTYDAKETSTESFLSLVKELIQPSAPTNAL